MDSIGASHNLHPASVTTLLTTNLSIKGSKSEKTRHKNVSTLKSHERI